VAWGTVIVFDAAWRNDGQSARAIGQGGEVICIVA